MNKKILLIVIFLIVICIVAFWFSRTKSQQTTQEIVSLTPTPMDLPISPVQNDSNTIDFSFSLSPPALPQSVKKYIYDPIDINSLGSLIAQAIRFEPAKNNSGENRSALYWSGKDGYLILYEHPLNLVYKENISSFSLPSEENANNAVFDLLSTFNLHDETVGNSQPSTQIFHYDGSSSFFTASSEYLANIRGFSIFHYLDNLPLFSSAGALMETSAMITNQKSFYSFSSPIIPRLTSQQSFNPLPYETALLAVKNNKGLLVSIEPADKDLYITDVAISSVVITSMRLGYAMNETQNSLDPVFVFEGKVSSGSRESRNASVRFLLSALGTPQ